MVQVTLGQHKEGTMARKLTYYKMLREVDEILSEEPYENWEPLIEELLTLRRLARKHHRLAEMDCNGEGWIRGQRYYGGNIDDWARKEYGYEVKSAYLNGSETSVFTVESDKVEAKILKVIKGLGKPWTVEFQGDPRGNTVKVFHGDRFVSLEA
jgi:hypothetical protein